MRWTLLVAGAAVCLTAPLSAQSQPIDSVALDGLRRILRLPQTTTEARRTGVPDSIIRVVLEEARRRGVPAGDAQEAVEVETDAVKAGAPRDNFWAFVQAQLAAGKRGRALAEAIRAEHGKRGVQVPRRGARGALEQGGPADAARRGGPPARRGDTGKADTAGRGRRRGP